MTDHDAVLARLDLLGKDLWHTEAMAPVQEARVHSGIKFHLVVAWEGHSKLYIRGSKYTWLTEYLVTQNV